jgi:4-hydroxybenzoate polyprenyltransferase
MGLSLTAVVAHATARPGDPAGLGLFLCGVAAAYSVDRLLDPPHAHARWVVVLLRMTAAGSVAAGGLFILELPVETAALVPVFGLAALGYGRLKRVPFAKALIVPAVWTWAAMALPFHDGSWLGWRWIQTPVAGPLFLLIASGCLLCDLKDVERDRKGRVPSLPARWGVMTAASVAMLIAVAAAVLAASERRPGLAIDGVCLALAGTCPMLIARDAIGPLLVDAILTLPGVLIAAHLL